MKKVSILAVQRLFWILVAVIACSLTTLLITPRQAQALSGNCSAEMVYDAVGTRGKGRCSSLGSDTKAQVTLDISIGVDRHSAWFTKTNTDYYTSYWVNNGQGLNGFPRSARVDLAPR